MFSFLLHSIKMIKNPLKRVNTYTSWVPLSLCFSKFLFIDIFVGRKRRDVEKWFWLHAFEFVDHIRLIHEVSTNYRELRERVPKLPLLCIIRHWQTWQLIQRVKSADWNIRLQFRIGYTAGIKSRLTGEGCITPIWLESCTTDPHTCPTARGGSNTKFSTCPKTCPVPLLLIARKSIPKVCCD
jgi:hypothetical protein